MELVWMLLAAVGLAELAAFLWLCKFVKRQLEGVRHQVRRVTAVLAVLEEQAAMYERAYGGQDAGVGGVNAAAAELGEDSGDE